MHGITIQEIQFFSLVWLVAFFAAFARSARESEYRNFWHGVSIGASAGFFAFGVVAFLFNNNSSDSRGSWSWLGISALVGLMSKEQDAMAKAILGKVFAISKIVFRDTDNASSDSRGKQ